MNPLRRKLLWVLVSYCLVVFCFGVVYWLAWRSQPTAFVFAGSLPVHQRIETLEGRIDRLEQNIAADRLLEEAPAAASDSAAQARIPAELDSLVSQARELTQELASVLTPLDFIYFSLITMSTLGYGDILPNSVFVRGLVILQVLTGMFLVVVVVNEVLLAYKQIEESRK